MNGLYCENSEAQSKWGEVEPKIGLGKGCQYGIVLLEHMRECKDPERVLTRCSDGLYELEKSKGS